jgi:subtilisin family serine protease
MAIVEEEGERYQENELIVARSHQRVVERELAERYQVTSVRVETSAELDLVRLDLDLDAVRVAAARLREPGRTMPDTLPDSVRDRSDLAVLVWGLRASFRRRYAGWVPSMDTNRLLDLIHAFPYRKGSVPILPVVALEEQWGTIPAPSGGPDAVRVGILDTGVFPHRHLVDRLAPGSDPVLPCGPVRNADKAMGHATFVAGLIAKRAPDAAIVARRALDDSGLATSSWEVAGRMAEFLTDEVDVLNLSFGCATGDGRAPLVLERAVRRLSARTIVVACAGNTGGDTSIPERTAIWPGALDDVVTVGVARPAGSQEEEWFSPHVPWVDLTAPGNQVTSTYLVGTVAWRDGSDPVTFSGYATWSGTSFAAAAVSGEIAARTRQGRVSAREALDQLLRGAAADRDIRPFEL